MQDASPQLSAKLPKLRVIWTKWHGLCKPFRKEGLVYDWPSIASDTLSCRETGIRAPIAGEFGTLAFSGRGMFTTLELSTWPHKCRQPIEFREVSTSLLLLFLLWRHDNIQSRQRW